ncbi:MAG: GNAT family N-acetyltransferase [Verrucomicrobia bacterium]|nr:GNAT family N-acetyltransferase [Verrucomicrobiota bacterium]
MSISDKRIAMSICIVENSQCCVLKIGYIEEYSDCSPSMLLAMETIKYAFEQQLASYEFLGSYESWQDMWTIGIRNYATVTLYPYSINSLLHLGTDFGRFLMRRMAPRSLYTGGTAGPQR